RARVPGDPQNPEAVGGERQGRELVEPGADAPATGVAGRVEGLDPSHPPAAGVEPAAMGAYRQAGYVVRPGGHSSALLTPRGVRRPRRGVEPLHDPCLSARRQSGAVGAEGDRPQLADVTDTEDPLPPRRVPDGKPLLERVPVVVPRAGGQPSAVGRPGERAY